MKKGVKKIEIETKDINKLSQLDRIEYRQRLISFGSLLDVGVILSIIIICFGMIYGLVDYLFYGFISIMFGIIIFFIFTSIVTKKRKELELEYFKVNLKTRKK